MERSAKRVSNHEATNGPASFETPLTRLLRMRVLDGAEPLMTLTLPGNFAVDSPGPNRIGFDLERVLMTEYRIDDFQKTYFVIDNFEQMFEETRKPFGPIYERLCDMEPYPADTVLPTDTVIHRGQDSGQRG